MSIQIKIRGFVRYPWVSDVSVSDLNEPKQAQKNRFVRFVHEQQKKQKSPKTPKNER